MVDTSTDRAADGCQTRVDHGVATRRQSGLEDPVRRTINV